jgi:hypothetical protein
MAMTSKCTIYLVAIDDEGPLFFRYFMGSRAWTRNPIMADFHITKEGAENLLEDIRATYPGAFLETILVTMEILS